MFSTPPYASYLPLPANTEKLIKKPVQNWYGGPKNDFYILIDDLKNKLLEYNCRPSETTPSDNVAAFVNEFLETATLNNVSWFSAYHKDLNENQTKLLVVCHMIYKYAYNFAHENDNYVFDGSASNDIIREYINEFDKWIKFDIKYGQTIILETRYLRKIYFKIEKDVLYLEKGSDQPQLNLQKLTSKVFSTIKAPVYKIRERIPKDFPLYSNNNTFREDGVCLGLSLFWLFSMHATLNSHTPKTLKNEFANALRVKNQEDNLNKYLSYNHDAPKYLLSSHNNFNNGYFKKLFHYIQDISASGQDINKEVTFGHAVLLMIALLKQNKLPQIYARIIDLHHAMAIAITQKGKLNKIYINDPNSYSQHVSFYIDSPEFSSEELNSMEKFNRKFESLIRIINIIVFHFEGPKDSYIHYLANYNRRFKAKSETIFGPFYNFKCYTSSLNSNKSDLKPLHNFFFEENLKNLLKLKIAPKKNSNTNHHSLISDMGEGIGENIISKSSPMIDATRDEKCYPNAFAMSVALMTKNLPLIFRLTELGRYWYPELHTDLILRSCTDPEINKFVPLIWKNSTKEFYGAGTL